MFCNYAVFPSCNVGNGSDVLPVPNLASNVAAPVSVALYSGSAVNPQLERQIALPEADGANTWGDLAFTLNSFSGALGFQGRLIPSMDRGSLTMQGYRAGALRLCFPASR